MNQQIVILVSVVVVIGVICGVIMMSNSPETYTAALKFKPSDDIYIPGMKADGTIVLTHKFKDIDDAIDAAAASVLTDASTLYPTKTVVNQLRASDKVANANETIARIANARHAEQAKLTAAYDSKYVNKNKGYRFVIGPGQPSAGEQIMTQYGYGGAHQLRNAGGGVKPNKFILKD